MIPRRVIFPNFVWHTSLTAAALVCLTLTAAHPFLQGQFPMTADGTLHLYRLVALDDALRHGSLWVRYVPGLAYGYGVPFFNYYSPLSLYPLEGLHLLGMSFVNAWLAGIVLYLLIGAIGAYLLGTIWAGEIAGLATAAAYTYAPYTLYDAASRGTVSELAALALLPWVLWAFRRLATCGQRRDLLLAVGTFAAFILMHNVITLHAAVLLVAYAVFLIGRSATRKPTAIRLALAFALALAGTAFFWLPALTETSFVKINEITATLPDIDVVRNLSNLGDMFAPPLTADPTQLQPPVPIAFSWVQIALGVLALGLIVRARKNDEDSQSGDDLPGRPYEAKTGDLRGWLILAAVLLAGLVFMNTHAAAWVWEHVPLIRYSQFPWRLVGLASLLLAVLAGAGVALVAARLASGSGRLLWLVTTLAAMVVYGMPWLYPMAQPTPAANSIIDAQSFERDTGWVATSSFGEYIPRWTEKLPDPNRLTGRYAAGEVILRLDPPAGVTVQQAEWGATWGHLTLSAEADTPLVFDWLYVPGWWAKVDGADFPVTPSATYGLVSMTIPAGRHTLEIGLGLTPTQAVATLVSWGAGMVLAGGLGFGKRLFETGREAPHSAANDGDLIGRPYTGHAYIGIVVLVGLVAFAFKGLVIDHAQTPIRRERFADGVAAGVPNVVQANFDNQFILLGYDLSARDSVSPDTVSLTLYWQLAGNQLDTDYSSVVRLRDAAGMVVSETGSFYPGGLATHHWLPGDYIQERLTVTVPAGTPPGAYRLEASLYNPADKSSLSIINEQGNPQDVKIVLDTLNVQRPAQPANLADFVIPERTDLNWSNALTLIGINQLPTDGRVGQAFPVEWVWRAERASLPIYQARFVWLTPANDAAAVSPDIAPVTGYDTEQWQAGDVWRGLHQIYIPGRLQAGDYTVALQLVDSGQQSAGDILPLGKMIVTTPQRIFVVPPMQQSASITWTNGITLLGYDLPELDIAPSKTVNLTLYWQSQTDLTTELRVFVHLVSADGHIVTQADGAPVSWSRPTTGWAPGEIIADAYALLVPAGVPPGEYTLEMGWYNPLTNERVQIVGGGDTWHIEQKVRVGKK